MSLENVGLILPDGISNYGTNTLAVHLVKLGIKGFALKKFNRSFEKDGLRFDGLELYDNFSHLSELLKSAGVTKLIVISKPINDDSAAAWEKDLKQIKASNNLELNLMWCDRNPNVNENTLNALIPENVFDRVICFYKPGNRMYKHMEKYFAPENILSTDLNVWNFSDDVLSRVLPFAERENVLLYAGRFTNSKGTNTLIEAYGNGKLGRYRYSLEGGGYSFSAKSGKITGALGVIQLLIKNKDIKTKIIHDFLKVHRDYENFWESLLTDQMNVYPQYSGSDRDADRRKMSYFLTPILSGENHKAAFLWEMAPEYVFYESIEQGLPVVCSKKFAETVEINGKPIIEHDGHGCVIFESYDELEDKLVEYEKDYDANVRKMLDFWVRETEVKNGTMRKLIAEFFATKIAPNPVQRKKPMVSLFD